MLDIFYSHIDKTNNTEVTGFLDENGKLHMTYRGNIDTTKWWKEVKREYVKKRVKFYEYKDHLYILNQYGCCKVDINTKKEWSNADSFSEKIEEYGQKSLKFVVKLGWTWEDIENFATIKIDPRPAQQAINNAARGIDLGQITNIPHGSSLEEVEQVREQMNKKR